MKQRRRSQKTFNPEKFLAGELKKNAKAESAESHLLSERCLAAGEKVDRVLELLRTSCRGDPGELDAESRLAMAALMIYFWGENFPYPKNIFHPHLLRERLCDALRTAFPADQVEPFVDKAIGVAEAFGRLSDQAGDRAEG